MAVKVAQVIYTVLLTPCEEGRYMATVPSLPGVVTQGNDEDDALAMAKEAIECHIEGLMLDGEPVPEEGPTIAVRVAELRTGLLFRVDVTPERLHEPAYA